MSRLSSKWIKSFIDIEGEKGSLCFNITTAPHHANPTKRGKLYEKQLTEDALKRLYNTFDILQRI